MSAKYQRVKQADLALPAPLRWLTRAFSSITLAVTLLVCVALFGVAATLPVLYLLLAGVYAAIVLGTVGVAVGLIWLMAARGGHLPRTFRIVGGVVLLLTAAAAGVFGCLAAHQLIEADAALRAYRTTKLYELPCFEMTEQEFYGWWPMRLILILFVINMIWATLRRIEFKFVNLGVLTVHTGIITLATGALVYSHFKLEGDMILFRQDLGGGFHNTFYDAVTPALYVRSGRGNLMMTLDKLPRYNDYKVGSLNLRLGDRSGFKETLGPRLHMKIPGFVSYGRLQSSWVPAARADHPSGNKTSPMLRLENGTAKKASGQSFATLLANVPARRAAVTPAWAIEYLIAPGKQRIRDFHARFAGRYGLVVRVPGDHFRKVYAIQPGQTLRLGDTGYKLTVRKIGAYSMPFITPGYRGAKDSRALIHVEGHGKSFNRIVMYRYPERSQDFTPAPQDSSVGPMGRRSDPDPAIGLTFIDASIHQFHLIADGPRDKSFRLVGRLSGNDILDAPLPDSKFPLGSINRPIWVHLTKQTPRAVRQTKPVITPRLDRNPKQTGNYSHALLPVLLTMKLPAGQSAAGRGGGVANGGSRVWRKLVWLHQMRYPDKPDNVHRPKVVDVPTIGPVRLTFSRQRHRLPFAVALKGFKMTPVPGSEIPQDYSSQLAIAGVGPQGLLQGQPHLFKTHMNQPVYYSAAGAPLGLGKIKISQQGWDPGDKSNPQNDAKNAKGQYTHQQRFSILGIGNNVGIHVIFAGGCLIALGIPWAFYVKPWLVQRKKRKIQEALQRRRKAGETVETDPDAEGGPGELIAVS